MAQTGQREPRTQEQRSGSTRSLILDAAVECLVAEGYERTTTVTVQARAGVSRGRLLHHFPSRAALLVAAAHHLADSRIQEMERWIAEWSPGSPSGAARVDRATELLWSTFTQPYFWAAMELWTAARTDDDLRQQLVPAERRIGRGVRHVIDTMYGPEHSSHPDFPQLRELLFTSMRGVALSYAIQPRDPRTDPRLLFWRKLARDTLLPRF
ncbi:MAG TPA: helix-turn-helix domain-containing protein [Pseudonocardia sp.]